MYTRLIQILLLILTGIMLLDGLPGLGVSVLNAIPGSGHAPQYNLAVLIMILIGIFALLGSRNRENKP
jgi:hypothetical protein